MILNLVLATSLAAIASPIQDVPAQDGGVVVTGEKNKKNKRVCKRAVATGSVMQKVTCRTAAEWNADTDKAISTLDRLRGEDRWREAVRYENDLRPKEDRPR